MAGKYTTEWFSPIPSDIDGPIKTYQIHRIGDVLLKVRDRKTKQDLSETVTLPYAPYSIELNIKTEKDIEWLWLYLDNETRMKLFRLHLSDTSSLILSGPILVNWLRKRGISELN